MAVLLGRQSAAANADFEASAWTIAWKFTAVASGTLKTIKAQTQNANAGFTSARLGIYDHDAGNNRPNNDLADSAVNSLTAAQGTGVFDATVSVSITNGTTYWLAFSGSGEQIDFKGDTSGAYHARALVMPATWGVSDNAAGTTNMIIWGESVDDVILFKATPILPKLTGVGPKAFTLGHPPARVAPSAGLGANLGLVSETDSLFSLARLKTKAIGLVLETDTAQTMTSNKSKVLGLVLETDLSQALSRAKAKTLGLVTETDLALALVKGINKVLGLVSESDIAQPLTASKNKLLGLITETDISLPLIRVKSKALGLIVEVDIGLPFGRGKSKLLGLASETDTAPHIMRAGVVPTAVRRFGPIVIGRF